MKRLKRPVSVLLSLLMVMSIFTALPVTASADTTYTITWYDENGWTLKTTSVAEGEVPDYGDPPTKNEISAATYEFTGWSPEPVAATQNASYIATYKMKFKDTNVIDGGMFPENNQLYWTLYTDNSDDSMYRLEIHSIYEDNSSSSSYYMPDFSSSEDAPWNNVKDKIRTVKFSSAIEAIGSYTFSGYTSLETVDFDYYDYSNYGGPWFKGVTKIGEYAFEGCSKLMTVPFYRISDIEEHAFENCTSLESVELDAAHWVGKYSFSGCTSLNWVTLPVLYELEESVFEGCTSLSSVDFEDPALTLNTESLSGIKEHAFKDCISLETITLPSSLYEIGYGSFENCTKLSTVNFSRNLTTISDEAFYGCSSLDNIIIPSEVSTIGENAFYGCQNAHNVYLYAPSTIDWNFGDSEFIVSDDPDESTKLHVVSENVQDYEEALSGINAVIVGDADKNIASWKQFQNLINVSSSIKLENDVVAESDDSSLVIHNYNTEITIDLNGHKIDRNLVGSGTVPTFYESSYSSENYVLHNNGKLTIIDSSEDQSGEITGGLSSGISNSGTIILKSGNITGNYGSNAGGIFNLGNSSVYMYGGKISGNKSCIVHNSYIDYESGQLVDNSYGGQGGGIYGGTVYLYGGEITSNTAEGMGGGIVCDSEDLHISGAPKVTGNNSLKTKSEDDIYLDYQKIVFDGALTDGARFGVSASTAGIFTEGFRENNPDGSVDDFFFTTDSTYKYLIELNSEAMLAEKIIDTWEALKQEVESAEVTDFTNYYDNNNLKSIYLTGNITSTGSDISVKAGQNVQINLSGCTLDTGTSSFKAAGKKAADSESEDIYAKLYFSGLWDSEGDTIKTKNSPAVVSDTLGIVGIERVKLVGEGSQDFAMAALEFGSTDNRMNFSDSTFDVNATNAISMRDSSGDVNLYSTTINSNVENSSDPLGAAIYCANGCSGTLDIDASSEINTLSGPGVYFESADATLNLEGGKITSRDSYAVSGTKAFAIKLLRGGLYLSGGKGGVYLSEGQYLDFSSYYRVGNSYSGDKNLATVVVMETPGIFTKGYETCFIKSVTRISSSSWTYTYLDPADMFIAGNEADSDGQKYCVISAVDPVGKTNEAALSKGPQNWAELQSALTAGGTVTLTKDITADVSEASTDTDLIVSKVTKLNLNGYTINRNLNTEENRSAEEPKSGRVIKATNSLTINDTSADGSGKITGGYLSKSATDKNGAGIYIQSGTLTINNGEITENRTEATTYTSGYTGGGGVYAYGVTSNGTTSGAIVVMNGGKITNNYSGYHGGGIVGIKEFTMNGGEISGNTSGYYGGGVYISKIFTLNNGVIKNNAIIKSGNVQTVGGGVYCYTTFTMNGGEISSNTAEVGGGLYTGSTAEIKEGLITNNHATIYAGGWFTQNNQNIHLSGGTITNNTADTLGGGVLLPETSSSSTPYNVKVSGNPKVYGNYGKDGANDNFNVRNLGIKIAGELSDGADIHITSGSPSKSFTNDYASTNPGVDPWKFFKSDDPQYIISTKKTGNSLVGEVCLEKNYFTGTNVVLDDGITMRYSLKVVNTDENREKYVTFSWGDNVNTLCDPEKHYALTLVEGKTDEYTVDCPIAAKEMADKITATLHIGSETVNADVVSVKDNLMTIVNDKNKDVYKKAAPLAQALLIYGNEAQKQFGYTSPSGEKAYDSEYELSQPAGTQAAFTELFTASTPAMPDAATENEIKENYGLDFYGASLLLRNKTTCVMYFVQTDESLAKNVTVTYNGEALEQKTEEVTGRIFYEIDGIKPQNLTDNFSVIMSDGTNSTEVPFNPGFYIGAGIYRSGSNEQLRNTLAALYNYSKEAHNYVSE